MPAQKNDAPTALRLALSGGVRIQRTRNQVACEVGEETVILSLENGEYYGLNAVASQVWALAQQPVTLGGICETLLREYSGISADRCREQVAALLGEMAALDLIEVAGDRGGHPPL